MKTISFAKVLALVNGLVPLFLLSWDAWHSQLGANPVNYAIRTTGYLALIFLMLTLAVTPLVKIFNWNTLTPLRRTFGVYACVHTAFHFLIYFTFDRGLNLGSTLYEISMRLYLMIGTTALVIMLPLAITSTDGMIKRLGPKRWKMLHRLTYVAAIAGVTHYLLLVKADLTQPLIFAAILSILLGYRFGRYLWNLRTTSQLNIAQMMTPSMTPSMVLNTGPWSGKLVIAGIFQETPEVKTFRLIAPQSRQLPFQYLPGQFLTLNLQIDGQPVKRSYTIASSPSRTGYCELTVKREELGLVSRYLHDQLNIGDELQLTAPLGKFTFTGDEDTKAIVFIAGGVGITPLMSKIRYLLDHAWSGKIFLFFSVRTAEHIIFNEELTYLEKRHTNFKVIRTLSNAQDDWSGERGRVTIDMLLKYVPRLENYPIHICGPTEMNNSLKELLLKSNTAKGLIHVESFGKARAPAKTVTTNGSSVTESEQENQIVVQFENSQKTVPIKENQTILEAAEQAGISLNYDCRSGVCGTCKVRLLRGQVTMDNSDILEPQERMQGVILTCQARCTESIVVNA
jgi:glycine betaine catabolism B